MLSTITGTGYLAHAVPSEVNEAVIVSSIQMPIRSKSCEARLKRPATLPLAPLPPTPPPAECVGEADGSSG